MKSIFDYPLIWVEIGRPIPRYLTRNAKLHASLYPNLTQYLITENLICIFKGDRFEQLDFIAETDLLHSFLQVRKTFDSPQKSFWINTTSRFFYLHAATSQMDLSRYLHMESDVVLLNSRAIDARFRNLMDSRLSYPLETPRLGCASIFVVRDQGTLKQFLNFSLDNWQEISTTDMTLLGDFANNFSNLVEVLPTWPRGVNNDSSHFFDAGTIGKFYLGSDARNHTSPFSRRGVKQNSTDFVPDLLHLNPTRWRVEESYENVGNAAGLSLKIGENELVNLHIHSKKIPSKPLKLSSDLRNGFLSPQSEAWRRGRLDQIVLLERISGNIKRRLGMQIKEHISYR
jgi:hypothetical protein